MKSAISFLYLKLFIIIFLLSNCTAINTVNESFQGLVKNNNSSTNGSSSYSYYDCYNDVKKCKDNQLCQITPSNNDYFKYREEAEIRGLSCNTIDNTTQSGKNTNSIDKMLKYALNRLIQLNISSKIEVEKKESILKKMNINEFNTFYKLCKNAFAESEPLKCDIALKNLN